MEHRHRLYGKICRISRNENGGKLKNINFRCKDDSWMDFGMKEVFDDTSQGKQNNCIFQRIKILICRCFLEIIVFVLRAMTALLRK